MLNSNSRFALIMILLILGLGAMDSPGEKEEITMIEVSDFAWFVIKNREISVLDMQQRFEIQKHSAFLRTLCDCLDGNDIHGDGMHLGCLIALNMQKYPEEDVERFAKVIYGKRDRCFLKNIYLYYAFFRYFGKKRFNQIMIDVFEEYKKYLSFYVAFPCARLPYLTDLVDRLINNDARHLDARIIDDSKDDRYNLVYIMREDQLRKALALADISEKSKDKIRLELLFRGDLEQIDFLPIKSYVTLYYGKVPNFTYCGFEILFDSSNDYTIYANIKGEIKRRIEAVKAENLWELPLRCVQSKHPEVSEWSVEHIRIIIKFLSEKTWMDSRYRSSLKNDYRKYAQDANTREYLDMLNDREGGRGCVNMPIMENTMSNMSHLIGGYSSEYSPILEAMCRSGFLPVLPEDFHAPWVISTNSISLTQNIVAFYTIFKDLLYWNEIRQCYEWANEPPEVFKD